MSPKIAVAALAVLLATAAGQNRSGQTFYVDSSSGDDKADGLSAAKAWKTLDRVNTQTFLPGDRILFRCGTAYKGQLRPGGSGSTGHPIVVDTYGAGDKPLIEAEGKFHEALLLKNQEYWEVANLQLTNNGPTREPFRYGARVISWDFGTAHHIHLKNLFVHDVNGSLVKKSRGEGHGIVWENGGDKVPSRFDGLLIEKCRLVRTDRNGICGFAAYPKKAGKWFPSLKVVIRDNLLEDIGGDAIKVWGCDRALVERNIVHGARQRCDDYAAGIWPWSSDNTVIQFNEVSGVKGMKDGEAFDSDGYCTHTTFQYNYSHDNDGGFMLICCTESVDTVVRYNISQNDRERLFHMAGPIRDIAIYNNVFYIGTGIDLHMFLWSGGRNEWPDNTTVANNIFYAAGTGRNSEGMHRKQPDDGTYVNRPGIGGSTRISFSSNLFFGNFLDIPADWEKFTFDPLFTSPGSGADGIASVAGYKLQPQSRCPGAGVLISGNGGRDFWGKPVPEGKKPAIGAFEP
ncbi:MAG: right-handed parallel beta-helix repeat-containing protein [Bryobacteraceae bacterium]